MTSSFQHLSGMQPLLLKRRWPCVRWSSTATNSSFAFEEILALEHEADSIARDVLLGIRTTFINPFDRDDIQSLIKKSLRKSRHCIRRVAERPCSSRGPNRPSACEPSG